MGGRRVCAVSPLANSNGVRVESTYSSGGNCVAAQDALADVNAYDSEDRTALTLSFIQAEWAAFAASAAVAPLGDTATDVPPVVSPLPDPLSVDLVAWYRARFTRFPPSPEQLAEYEWLARRHGRDPLEPLACRVCRTAFPCLLGADARTALAAARGDATEFDSDPLVRLSARVLAAQRAAEGFAALLLPLLADARRVVAAHRPDAAGWCPVCQDPCGSVTPRWCGRAACTGWPQPCCARAGSRVPRRSNPTDSQFECPRSDWGTDHGSWYEPRGQRGLERGSAAGAS